MKIYVMSFAAIGMIFVGAVSGAHAEIWSSYDYTPRQIDSKCVDHQIDKGGSVEALTACMDCFFLQNGMHKTSEFRRAAEITYNTDTQKCNVDPTSADYYDNVDSCTKLDWPNDDECYRCLTGENGELAFMDAEGDYSGVSYIHWLAEDYYECDVTDSYLTACKSGWYGFPEYDANSTLTGCDRCPDNGASDVTFGHATTITNCYSPVNKPKSDSTGTFVFTEDCYYTK